MGTIRAFQREESEEVAALYLKIMRGQRQGKSQKLADYFAHVFLDNPWRHNGIDALVYLEGAQIAGFLGVMNRPMQFAGKPIKTAVVSQLFIDRDIHQGMGALALLRKCFQGPQDLCFTDGAAEASAKIWEAAGGDAARLYSFNWIRPLRLISTLQEHSIGRKQGGFWNVINGAVDLVGSPLDTLAQRWSGEGLRPSVPCETVSVDVDTLLDAITEIGWREKLKPAYERASFRWLIAESEQAQYGQLRLCITRDKDGRTSGWFVYYLRPSGVCYLLQLGARRSNEYRTVLRALFADAAAGGGSCVKGQSQPKKLVDLTEEHCIFRHPNSSVLIHSKDSELRAAIHRGDAMLTRLDGESWLRFSAEEWV